MLYPDRKERRLLKHGMRTMSFQLFLDRWTQHVVNKMPEKEMNNFQLITMPVN